MLVEDETQREIVIESLRRRTVRLGWGGFRIFEVVSRRSGGVYVCVKGMSGISV
jgi:hypothetical protein